MSLKQQEIETYDYYTKEIVNDEYVKKALLEEKIELNFKVSKKALVVSVKQLQEPLQSAVIAIPLDTDIRFHGAYKLIKEVNKNILEDTVYKP